MKTMLVLLVALMAGCATQSPQPESPQPTPTPSVQIEVTPEMRKFVLDGYKQVVLNNLADPAQTQFPPCQIEIVALRDPSSDRSTMFVTGVLVDAPNGYGALIRQSVPILTCSQDSTKSWKWSPECSFWHP
jgi:hypothetical protein